MIQVKNLTKAYGKFLALDDVSFHVKKGHIYGLLGPNGAGKSTTMNILTGYIAATDGTVMVDGHELGKENLKIKQSIGYLPELPPLYPDMCVKEYLDFVARLKKVPRTEWENEIVSVMKSTGISDVSHRLIKNLSKGYKQRVGIAQALIGSPKVIILDEPMVGLDPQQVKEIRTLIKGLKEKHTVILSSHNLSEISTVCDDVLMIAGGKVLAMDTTENILRKDKSKQSLVITVKGTADKASNVLDKIKTIEEYQIKKEEDGLTVFEITAKSNKDVREEISFALSDARILIMEMNVSKASLEDIYLDLMKKSEDKKKGNADESKVSRKSAKKGEK